MSMDFTGELAGLAAAGMWAVAAVLFRTIALGISPLVLNLYKGLLAIGMLIIALALQGESVQTPNTAAAIMLLASGVIGIGIGDTAFFAALSRLGARSTVLIAETLAPPMTALIAMFFLAEMLPASVFLAILITLSGVALVVFKPGAMAPSQAARFRSGLVLGLVAALCQAVGAVVSRAALTQTDIGPLWSSLVRILGGIGILTLWLPIARQRFWLSSRPSPGLLGLLVLATFLGTFMGITLQQLALQNTSAGVAQTLFATSSLFVLPLVALRGESVSFRSLLGALVAVAGVAILFIWI